jgi:enamine deaminase RidA (YjgF/YER057c/UK114 family)
MAGKIAARLAEFNIELPNTQPPVANYVPAVITGSQVYIAGQVPVWNGALRYVGQLGKDISIEDGQKAAALCGLNVIAQLKAAIADLDRVKRCVKVNVFISSALTFTDQPKVANGASDLFVQLFGEAGKHARSAVGVAQLPLGVCVEVDAIFEIA